MPIAVQLVQHSADGLAHCSLASGIKLGLPAGHLGQDLPKTEVTARKCPQQCDHLTRIQHAALPPTGHASNASNAAAPTEALDAFDFLERIDSIASHWRAINESLRETHRHHSRVYPEPVSPLPDWAVERLQDQGRAQAACDEYSQYCDMLKEALRLASGVGAAQRYEVWESAQGRRLSIQHESIAEADAELGLMKERFPKAFIARVDVRMKWSLATDPALLDTMIGRLSRCSTTFRCSGEDNEEDRIEIQDQTGRTVTLPASVVMAHPTFARISEKGRQAIAHSVERSARRRAEPGGEL